MEKGISWSKIGKPLVAVGGEREGRLLRKGHVGYSEGRASCEVWGVGEERSSKLPGRVRYSGDISCGGSAVEEVHQDSVTVHVFKGQN